MSDILRLLVAVILLTIGLVAYFLVLNALFSPRIERTKSVAQSMPVRSAGIGLVNFVFFAVIATALLAGAETAGPLLRGILILPAVVILAALAFVLSLGLVAMSNMIGEKIFPNFSAWKQTLWGTVCLSLACVLPLIGWFLLLPYIGFVGIGAVILGFLQRANQT